MNLIFVHLGKSFPKYLKYNIDATVGLNLNAQIWLITDNKSIIKQINKKVKVYIYERDSQLNSIAQELKHPKEFRNDFWFLSIERFFALERFLRIHNNPSLHVESDVLISKDFPLEIIESTFKGISFPIVSQVRGIASCLYIENHESISELSKFSIEEIHKNNFTSDMIILRNFYNAKINNSPMLFPTAIPSLSHYNQLPSDDFLRNVQSSFSILQGVIDGHDLGVNYLGTDARNARGVKYYFRKIEGSFIRIENIELKYNKVRKFIDISNYDQKISFPVYAIHGTSKSLLLFNKITRSKYLQLLFHFNKKGEKKTLSIIVLISAIFTKIKSSIKPIITGSFINQV